MKVSNEINDHSKEQDKPILLWLLSRYKWQSDNDLIVTYKFKQYGKEAWQRVKVWEPTKEGILLYNNRHILK